MKVGSSVTTVASLVSTESMVAAFVASLLAFAPSLQTSKLNLSLIVVRVVFELLACSEALSVDFCVRRVKNATGFRRVTELKSIRS